ncbi:MAG: chondroitinase-B domain-containing protein [Verrucomicrobiota bacterium]
MERTILALTALLLAPLIAEAQPRSPVDLLQETPLPYRCPTWLRGDSTGIWVTYGLAAVSADDSAWNNSDSQQPALRHTVTVSSLAELKAWAAKPTPSTRIIVEDGDYADAGAFTLSGIVGTRQEPVVITARHPLKTVFRLGGFTLAESRWVTIEGIAFRGPFTAKAERAHVTLSRNQSCRLTGCIIEPDDGGVMPGKAGTRYSFLQLMDGVANRVDHCRIRGKKSMGPMIVIRPTERSPLLEYNQFMDFAFGKINGFEGLQLGNDYTHRMRAVVRCNWFERLDGEAEVISVKTTDNTIFANTFLDNAGEVVVRAGNGTRVIANLFINSNGAKKIGGIRNQGDDTLILGNDFLATVTGVQTQCGDTAVDFPPGVDHYTPAPGKLEITYRQSRRVQVLGNRFINVAMPLLFNPADTRQHQEKSGRTVTVTKNLPPIGWRIAGNLIQGTATPVQGSGEVEMTWLANLVAGPDTAEALGRPFAPEAMRLAPIPIFTLGADGRWRDANGPPLIHPGVRKAATGPGALPAYREHRHDRTARWLPMFGTDEANENERKKHDSHP